MSHPEHVVLFDHLSLPQLPDFQPPPTDEQPPTKPNKRFDMFICVDRSVQTQWRPTRSTATNTPLRPQLLTSASCISQLPFPATTTPSSSSTTVTSLKTVDTLSTMLSQNIQHTNIMDLFYWKDTLSSPTSSYLLPLWTLNCPIPSSGSSRSSNNNNYYGVSCIATHPVKGDIIAVGYASASSTGDETSSSLGAVACFSLKRPGQPLWCTHLESDVTCLSFKQTPTSSSSNNNNNSNSNNNIPVVVAVGCQNGLIAVVTPPPPKSESTRNVLVIQQQQRSNYSSIVYISWKYHHAQNVLKTISADGTVSMWKLEGSKLTAKESFLLKPGTGSSTTIASKNSSSSLFKLRCLDINDEDEDGDIAAWITASDNIMALCSLTTRQTLWQSPQLLTNNNNGGGYLPHIIIRRCPVVGSNLCLTLSLDWHVFMWDTSSSSSSNNSSSSTCRQQSYVKKWDIGCEATDIQFAPGNKDIFAVITTNGVIKIYNLAVDPNQPVCSQKVVDNRKRRLTRIMFSRRHPMIVVGDDQGDLIFLKLPPTLTTTDSSIAGGGDTCSNSDVSSGKINNDS